MGKRFRKDEMEEKLKRILDEKKTLIRSLRKELQYMKSGKLHIKKIKNPST